MEQRNQNNLMPIYVSETEMLERFVDSLKKSANRASEFITSEETSKPELFVDFIEGLKIAAGSSHQLGATRMDPRWLTIRDLIENVLDLGKTMPPTKGDDSQMWNDIKTLLTKLAENGQKLYNLRSMARVDVLSAMTAREQNARIKNDG